MIVLYRSTSYGRNRAIVITESPARVVAAIRITSVRWQSYLLLINTEFGPRRPCVRCTAVRITRLAFIGVVFVPRGLAEWPVRVDRACVMGVQGKGGWGCVTIFFCVGRRVCWGGVGLGGGGEGNIINIISSSPVGSKNASGRGNVNNVNNVKSLYSKNLIPAGEMLIMLIMLNQIGDSWEI